MRLAIADPPYLGRAARNYGPDATRSGFGMGPNSEHSGAGRTTGTHPQAHLWDNPATHAALVRSLAEYDGWAVGRELAQEVLL